MKNIIDSLSKNIEKINEIRGKYHKSRSPKKLSPKKRGPSRSKISEIELSNTTIVKTLFWIVAFFLIIQSFAILQNIVIITGIALFIALGLGPIIDSIEKWHIPRPIAIILLYVVFLGTIGVLFVGIIPIMAEQLGDIALNSRQFLANIDTKEIPLLSRFIDTSQLNSTEIQEFVSQNLGHISQNLQSVAGSTLEVVKDIFNGVFNFIFALVLIFFILLEKEQIGHFLLQILPDHAHDYMSEKSHVIQDKIAKWVRGQALLMLGVGILMYVGLKILEFWFGMPYALTIAVICGTMGLFPYIGVSLSGLLAVLVSLNLGVWYAPLAVIALIALVQFIEGNVLSPLIMEKVVGLSPVVVILSLAIMGTLGNHFGGVPLAIVSMILSIPVAASLAIFIEEYANRDHKKEE